MSNEYENCLRFKEQVLAKRAALNSPKVTALLDQLQKQRQAISDYGYKTGRTNDANIQSMEREFVRIGIQLSDEWRDAKSPNDPN